MVLRRIQNKERIEERRKKAIESRKQKQITITRTREKLLIMKIISKNSFIAIPLGFQQQILIVRQLIAYASDDNVIRFDEVIFFVFVLDLFC